MPFFILLCILFYVASFSMPNVYGSFFLALLCTLSFFGVLACYEHLKERVKALEKALSDIEERR